MSQANDSVDHVAHTPAFLIRGGVGAGSVESERGASTLFPLPSFRPPGYDLVMDVEQSNRAPAAFRATCRAAFWTLAVVSAPRMIPLAVVLAIEIAGAFHPLIGCCMGQLAYSGSSDGSIAAMIRSTPISLPTLPELRQIRDSAERTIGTQSVTRPARAHNLPCGGFVHSDSNDCVDLAWESRSERANCRRGGRFVD